MKAIHRFRRAEQLRFFDRNRVLPLWSSLAEDVRQAVTRLTAENRPRIDHTFCVREVSVQVGYIRTFRSGVQGTRWSSAW